MKRSQYPTKRTMNLFYKPDRTTKPATAALYVLFALAVLLGLSKFFVYDLWAQAEAAEAELAAVQGQLDAAMAELLDYADVREQYNRYAETSEEAALIDRMDVLALLDYAVGGDASLLGVAINGTTVQVQLGGVTLAEAAAIVSRLEASPIVSSTVVNTASATNDQGSQASVRIELQKSDEPAVAAAAAPAEEEAAEDRPQSTLEALVDEANRRIEEGAS